ncbi:hypothetical protein BKA93DRAFT_932207 [Sparassis latifolia]
MVKHDLLSLPPPQECRYRNVKKTKKVLRAAYPRKWEAAMLKMEKMQPLLALYFEADDDDDVSHVSTSIVSTSVGKPSASETVGVSTAATSQTSAVNKRRRGHSSSSSKPKKKPAANVALQHAKDTTFAPVTAPTLEPQLGAITNILVPPAPSSLTSSSGPTAKVAVDVSFINIDSSIENLIDMLSGSHTGLTSGFELLNAMKLKPAFGVGSPTPEVIVFIEHIENADPNAPDLSEDDLGTAWGHYQFTAGSMTSSSTCKVARHVCFVNGIEANTYLSEAYLETTFEILWRLWKAAGGPVVKGKSKAVPPSDAHTMSTISIPESSAATQTSGVSASADNAQSSPRTSSPVNDSVPSNSSGTGKLETDTRDSDPSTYLNLLNRDELFEWIIDRKLAGNVKLGKKSSSMKKDKLVSIILSAEATGQPSKAEVETIVQQRKVKKMAASKG